LQIQIWRDALYAPYEDRQKADAETLRRDENVEIPGAFDYDSLAGLSAELKAKLTRARPVNLLQAGRIEGMTPAALTLILARVRRERRNMAAG